MVTKRMDDEDLFSDSDMGAAPLASPVNRCGDQDYRSFSMGSEKNFHKLDEDDEAGEKSSASAIPWPAGGHESFV